MSHPWIQLESESQFEEAVKGSFGRPVVFFKHSTRCAISSMALNRLNSADAEIYQDVECYFLDLLKHRGLSNKMADDFSVYHQSPQLLLVKNGECVFEASHGDIQPRELKEQLALLT